MFFHKNKGKAWYLMRLDDACPTFTKNKWEKYFEIFRKYNIKPIIAVIPRNEDNSLKKEDMDVSQFWEMVKGWQKDGWCIALHGLNHVYINNERGILGLTPHSEFVGLSLEEQNKKIKEGVTIFQENGIERPSVFVAPSHSFDENTIKSLKYNGINIISDGLYTHPYEINGITYISCQLWYPQIKTNGVWTIC